MYYFCARNKQSVIIFCLEKNGHIQIQKIPEKVVIIYLCNFFFFIPSIILAPLSRSLPVVTQIQGHIAGPPPPSPLRHVPSFLSREEVSIFFPRRLASNCTYSRCWALSAVGPFFFVAFLQIKSNIITVGIKLKEKQTLAVFEGKTTRRPGRPADN